MVEEGAGLNEEEVELAGDGSTEEGESMQRAESNEEVELLRLVLCAFIQGCSRHLEALMRFLWAFKIHINHIVSILAHTQMHRFP